ncbi:MAG TPA: hypothetical protein VIW67_05320 [Terriglobales bacterium]|jgi:hypothetical protein
MFVNFLFALVVVQFENKVRIRAWPLAVPLKRKEFEVRAVMARLSRSQGYGDCALLARYTKLIQKWQG